MKLVIVERPRADKSIGSYINLCSVAQVRATRTRAADLREDRCCFVNGVY